MATLLYTIFGITAGASLHCAVRREISPCTCAPHDTAANIIQVTCERMDSFSQVYDALQDRFVPESSIWLKITHSQLEDLGNRTFADMNMNLKNLRLNHNNLSSIPVSAFRGLTKTEFLSLSDNYLEDVPREMFDHMPNIGTIDFARSKIKAIRTHDFHALSNLKHLVLASNELSRLEAEAFPSTIVNLHLGKNNLTSLNGTIRNLPNLKLLFINSNDLVTLEGELPPNSPNLMMILANYNKLEYLPSGFKTLPYLDSLYFVYNHLKTLGGNLKHASKLQSLYVFNNFIDGLAEDEFEEAENIEEIQMAYNLVRSLNRSLLPIKQLRVANFSNNLLEEFSLKEITGLKRLRILDLSHNRIEYLTGRLENQIEPSSLIFELRLEHNLLKSLDGALMGLNNLRILSLSNNLLQRISPEDFIGLEQLEILDISNNQLKTLEETSKTFLPSLAILNASYNLLTTLDRDFHGLPVLCLADLSNNIIKSISPDLVAHTRCTTHGVPNKLEILLQENPILCDDNLPELITAMDFQQARLLGVAHCLVPQSIDHPILLQQQQQNHLFPTIIQTQLPINNPNPVMQPPPAIIQVFVPVPAPLISVPHTEIHPTKEVEPLQIETTTHLANILSSPPIPLKFQSIQHQYETTISPILTYETENIISSQTETIQINEIVADDEPVDPSVATNIIIPSPTQSKNDHNTPDEPEEPPEIILDDVIVLSEE